MELFLLNFIIWIRNVQMWIKPTFRDLTCVFCLSKFLPQHIFSKEFVRRQKNIALALEERGIAVLHSSDCNVPDRNYQDDNENDADYADAACTEGSYQLMQRQHELEKMTTENSKDVKIPIVINATNEIRSSKESGTQDDILEHDSDRKFLLSLLLYLRKVGKQELEADEEVFRFPTILRRTKNCAP
uniref:BESS domain-containing protein n=1 Tax=Glossina palpalis gambiensis TaxID=67801 RepID=A0A1B0BKT6_9MUSC